MRKRPMTQLSQAFVLYLKDFGLWFLKVPPQAAILSSILMFLLYSITPENLNNLLNCIIVLPVFFIWLALSFVSFGFAFI